MRQQSGVTKQRWPFGPLFTLTAAVTLSVTTEMLPTGLLLQMSRDLGVSPARLGLLVTGYALMVAIFAAPLASATARLPRRALLVSALVGYGLSNVILALSTNYAMALAARLVGGLIHGLFWAIVAGYTAKLVSPERMGRAITIVFAGGTIAIGVGVPLGTAVGLRVGWQPTFAVLAGLSLATAVLARRMLPKLPGASAATPVKLTAVLRVPGVGLIVVATAVIMLGYFSFYTYVTPFLRHQGLSESALGPALLVYGAAGAVGMLLAGVLVDRRPRGGVITAVATLTVSFTVLATLHQAVGAAIVLTATAGLALGSMPSFLQSAILRSAPHVADPASALNASAFNIGIGGGALLGGFAMEHAGYSALPLLAALLTAAGVLLIGLGRRNGFPALRPVG